MVYEPSRPRHRQSDVRPAPFPVCACWFVCFFVDLVVPHCRLASPARPSRATRYHLRCPRPLRHTNPPKLLKNSVVTNLRTSLGQMKPAMETETQDGRLRRVHPTETRDMSAAGSLP